MLVVSWIAAVVACLGYGIGSVLQSVGARRAAHVTGVTGVALIMVQAPYLLGLTADGIAFVANVVALQQLPLFLVQAILTASVGVTAVIAAVRGTHLARRDWLSLGALGLGLVALSLSADSDNAVRISTDWQYVILATSALPVLLGLVGARMRGRRSALVLAFAAGSAYTGVAVASRAISGTELGWFLLVDPMVWTILIGGVFGTIFFALALQRGSVTSVTAITFMVEMVVPSIVGLLLFGDSVVPGTAVLAGAGFLFAVAGTVSLMRFAT